MKATMRYFATTKGEIFNALDNTEFQTIREFTQASRTLGARTSMYTIRKALALMLAEGIIVRRWRGITSRFGAYEYRVS